MHRPTPQPRRAHPASTFSSLGTRSLGVSRPRVASMAQEARMVRMMAKSLTSFRTCRWRGLGLGWPGLGAAPGTPPGRSTQSHPHAV